MKAILLCLAVLIAVVASERCQTVSDCHVTTCGTGGGLVCERDECTCAPTCSQQSDCHNHCQNNGQPHCVDGHCTCRGF